MSACRRGEFRSLPQLGDRETTLAENNRWCAVCAFARDRIGYDRETFFFTTRRKFSCSRLCVIACAARFGCLAPRMYRPRRCGLVASSPTRRSGTMNQILEAGQQAGRPDSGRINPDARRRAMLAGIGALSVLGLGALTSHVLPGLSRERGAVAGRA